MDRQTRTDSIISDHVFYSMAGALIPIPLIDIGAVAAVQFSMIRAIRSAKQLAPAPVEIAVFGQELAPAPVGTDASSQKLPPSQAETAASGQELAPAPVETAAG